MLQPLEHLAQRHPVHLRQPHERRQLRVEHAALELLQVGQAELGRLDHAHLREAGGVAQRAKALTDAPKKTRVGSSHAAASYGTAARGHTSAVTAACVLGMGDGALHEVTQIRWCHKHLEKLKSVAKKTTLTQSRIRSGNKRGW